MFDEFYLEIRNNLKPTQSRIDEFCNKIEVKLPKDYQQFLLDYNGIIFNNTPCFYIPEINCVGELLTLYGFDFDNSIGTDLEKSYHYNFNYNFNYNLDGSTLVIGHCYTDKGCLCIMLINTEDIIGIFACDLFYGEFFFEESSEENNTYKIADSFSDFVDSLKYPQNNNMVFFPEYNFSYKMCE